MRSLKRSVVSLVTLGALTVGATLAVKYWNSRDDAERSDGVVVDKGDVDALSIRLGDCFLDPGTDVIEQVTATPCADAHDYQAYYIHTLADSAYPGQSKIDADAEEVCVREVPAGASDTLHAISWIGPSVETWVQINDRQIVCTISMQDGSQMTGSMVTGS